MRVWRIATFHQALFYMQDRCHLHQALFGGQIIVPSNRSQSNFTYCVICSSSEPCHLDPEDVFFAPVIYKLAKWCTFVYHAEPRSSVGFVSAAHSLCLSARSSKCGHDVNWARVQLHTTLQGFCILFQKCHALPAPAALCLGCCMIAVH